MTRTSFRFATVIAIPLAVVALACGGPSDAELERRALAVDVLTSNEALIVTQNRILDERFSLERVLTQLISKAGSPQSADELYTQWWDLQNDAEHSVAGGVSCNGFVNGFTVDCPRTEGLLAAESPFDGGADDYFPIALVNRFDLAPPDGAHCGEYRIIYGKTSSFGLLLQAFDRNLIIFEPQLPNPNPEAGLEGCRPIAELWAGLMSTPLEHRADVLEQLYFGGIDGFPPVIHPDHFKRPNGQIRTNQFMFLRNYFGEGIRLQPWQLREFKLVRPLFSNRIELRQVTVKTNPQARLFDNTVFSFRGPGFRNQFLTQVAPLASAADVNDIGLSVPDIYNAGQSTEQGNESNIVFHLGQGNGAFEHAIADEIPVTTGQSLNPTHIVRRAMTQTCAGCHQLSIAAPNNDLGDGLTWPASLVFVQISEQTRVFCDNPFQGLCFQISPALRNEFLPRRAEVLSEFLNGGVAIEQGALRVH